MASLCVSSESEAFAPALYLEILTVLQNTSIAKGVEKSKCSQA